MIQVQAPQNARTETGSWTDDSGMGLVEVLIALVILSFGLLSVAGISLSVGAQTRWATWETDQSLVAQEVLERVQSEGYESAANGTETVSIGNREYDVTREVEDVANRVKEVRVSISSTHAAERVFVTRVYKPRPLPPPPEE